MKLVVPYVVTLIAFAGLDAIWLGFVANRFYRTELGGLMAEKFNLWAAIAFYLIYALGVMVFAVAPTLSTGTWRDAAFWGFLFGFFAYATYDLTNLATVRDWPVRLTFVDLLWGACLTAIGAACAHAVARSA